MITGNCKTLPVYIYNCCESSLANVLLYCISSIFSRVEIFGILCIAIQIVQYFNQRNFIWEVAEYMKSSTLRSFSLYLHLCYKQLISIYSFLCFPIGEPQTIQVGVKSTMDFPLDIYYLMDQSSSMQDDLANLKTQASQLGMYIYKVRVLEIGMHQFFKCHCCLKYQALLNLYTLVIRATCMEPRINC